MILLVIAPAALAAICVYVGAHRPAARFLGRDLLLLSAVTVASGLMFVAAQGHDDVPTDRFVIGLLIAAGLCLVPTLLYYCLGRSLNGRPVAMWIVAAIALVPLLAGLLAGYIVIADYSNCAPDAYECPL